MLLFTCILCVLVQAPHSGAVIEWAQAYSIGTRTGNKIVSVSGQDAGWVHRLLPPRQYSYWGLAVVLRRLRFLEAVVIFP